MSKKEPKHENSISKKKLQDSVVATEAEMGAAADSAGSRQPDPQATRGARGDSEALEAKVDELTGDLQRLQAEFANYKRRETEAKADLLNMAKINVVMQLLPILDNLDRALVHRPDDLKDNAWAAGVEQVGKQALETLRKIGVERIKSLGQPFDHSLHEAVGMEGGEGEQEVVIEELQPGYLMGDQVIRHAMVKVARK